MTESQQPKSTDPLGDAVQATMANTAERRAKEHDASAATHFVAIERLERAIRQRETLPAEEWQRVLRGSSLPLELALYEEQFGRNAAVVGQFDRYRMRRAKRITAPTAIPFMAKNSIGTRHSMQPGGPPGPIAL